MTLNASILYGTPSQEKIAQALHKLADNMQKQIDYKLNPAISDQNPTARRLRIAEGMRKDGQKMQKTQAALYALSDLHKSGGIKTRPLLLKIRNKKQVELVLFYQSLKEYERNLNSSFGYYREQLEKLGINSLDDWQKAAETLKILSEKTRGPEKEEADEKQGRIKALERDIIDRKIPGFFPTPEKLIEKMVFAAQVQDGDTVLDPSAGKGDILDFLLHRYGDRITLSAIEINSNLREILKIKGYTIRGENFLESSGSYDKILMNPPFEKGQDIDHVYHAYESLKPGGRLVSLVSEGVMYRGSSKEEKFRSWLDSRNASVSVSLKEEFKKGFKRTGVAVRMIVIDKPEDDSPKESLEEQAIKEIQALQKLLGKEGINGLSAYPDLSQGQEGFFISERKSATTTKGQTKKIPEVKLKYIRETAITSEKISSSLVAANLFRQLFEEGTMDLQEQFFVLYLNRMNRVITYYAHAVGGISGVVADTRLILATAIKCLASGIILCHNHPSGNLSPSEPDITITGKLQSATLLLDMKVLDHIILTSEGYYSFSDENLL